MCSFYTDATEGTEFDTLEFTLKIKCTSNKLQNKESFRAEDMYENHSGKSYFFIYIKIYVDYNIIYYLINQ